LNIKESVINKYGSYGSSFIITPYQYLISFDGDETNDLIVKSKISYSTDKPIVIQSKKFIQNENIDDWMTRFNKLTSSPSIQQLNLSKIHVEVFQDSVKHYKGTHLRIFTIGDEIKVRIFDFTKFVYEITFDGGYAETTLKNVKPKSNFSVTLSSKSFLKLPQHDYNVELLENDIIEFISLDDSIEFLFRNQQIQEPIVEFTNEKLGREISLLLHPKTS
jgi:hypothetical protein